MDRPILESLREFFSTLTPRDLLDYAGRGFVLVVMFAAIAWIAGKVDEFGKRRRERRRDKIDR